MEEIMKACEIIEALFNLAEERDYSKSCDKCVSGNPEVNVKKAAVTMFASPDVIKEAKKWGAELLIVHEPVFHSSKDETDELDNLKRKLIEDSGITLYRYHDHTHYTVPDIIAEGEFKYLGLDGKMECTNVFDLVRLYPEKPITPRELAILFQERLGIKHVRICGVTDEECTCISGMFGAPGDNALAEMKRPETQIVVVGETREWLLCEYTRDAAQLGLKKSLLVLGHAGSERDGMKHTADILSDMFPDVEFKYFECGEVYTYTD